MALDLACNTTVYYTGNDVQTDYLYPFETIEDIEVKVAFYNEATNEYVKEPRANWTIVTSPAGPVVRFLIPPPSGEKFVIWRLTKLDPMKAIFSPGHPIKAGDLNDNFEQLQHAIEDNRCIIEGDIAAQGDKYWRKADETVYKPEDWLSDNQHVATTAAIDDRIIGLQVDIINEIGDINTEIDNIKNDINDINVNIDVIEGDINIINEEIAQIGTNLGEINAEVNKKVDKAKGITGEQQRKGEWVTSPEYFAYTDALVERYDTLFLPEDTNAPQPGEDEIIQPGKVMITPANQMFVWNGDSNGLCLLLVVVEEEVVEHIPLSQLPIHSIKSI